MHTCQALMVCLANLSWLRTLFQKSSFDISRGAYDPVICAYQWNFYTHITLATRTYIVVNR